jgi:hypothetical protein
MILSMLKSKASQHAFLDLSDSKKHTWVNLEKQTDSLKNHIWNGSKTKRMSIWFPTARFLKILESEYEKDVWFHTSLKTSSERILQPLLKDSKKPYLNESKNHFWRNPKDMQNFWVWKSVLNLKHILMHWHQMPSFCYNNLGEGHDLYWNFVFSIMSCTQLWLKRADGRPNEVW